MANVLLANISWNAFDWRQPFINPNAGHEYARTSAGHESLNFEFDKLGIDDEKTIRGFVQWTAPPTSFDDGGLIIFYSQNTDKKEGEIVGVYGKVEILRQPENYKRDGFKNNNYSCNLKAEKEFSLLFPIRLPANFFKKGNLSLRLVGENGFAYKDVDFAEEVLFSELNQMVKIGFKGEEFQKLVNIYSYYTGRSFEIKANLSDYEQQEDLESYYKTIELEKIKINLRNVTAKDSELVLINGKVYKRDNRTIAMIKRLRNFECQLCGRFILKKNGSKYIEAAHINAKCNQGTETPDNILILCPNHHKEFDFGERAIISQTRNRIIFKLNDKRYDVDLSV